MIINLIRKKKFNEIWIFYFENVSSQKKLLKNLNIYLFKAIYVTVYACACYI